MEEIMNYINCKKALTPELLEETVKFWAQNSYQHIGSILNSYTKDIPVPNVFENELKRLKKVFTMIYDKCCNTKNTNELSLISAAFLHENKNFINLLERIKFEAFNGYPIISQSIFHYIYEHRYINAILSKNTPDNNVLISLYFKPFKDSTLLCIYNHMYFWSIIGAMHPAILLGISPANDVLPTALSNKLKNTTNKFNTIAFMLSSLEKPISTNELSDIFINFESVNDEFLHLLTDMITGKEKVLPDIFNTVLPESFYGSLSHMIAEHTYVNKLNKHFKLNFAK